MIKLVNVSKYYNSNGVVALGLRKVSLEFHANEFVAIVGESGSGKTTLLNVICGIDSYEEGELFLNGEETSYFSSSDLEDYRKKYVAFVFQNYNLIDSYTVLQNVEAPMLLAGTPKKEAKARALEIIRRVGLEQHVKHKATKLSGGQKQRVVIARALAKDCPIIAADEPTGNLDSDSSKQIMALLQEIAKDKLVIVVTHDYDQVRDYATRKIRMYDGEVVEDIEIRHPDKQPLRSVNDVKMKLNLFQNMGIALRNLLSVPKKSLLMIIIFTFFSFFVALSYGGFLNSLRDFDISFNSYFQNTSISRVIIRKADLSPFTDADIAELAGLDNVDTVFQNDYLLDVQTNFVEGEGMNWDNSLTTMFLPLELATPDDLVAGVMPTEVNEILLALPESMLLEAAQLVGKSYSIADWGNFKPAQYTTLEVTGVVAASSYFMRMNWYGDSAFMMVSQTVRSVYQTNAYFTYLTGNTFLGQNNQNEDVRVEGLFNYTPLRIDNTLANNILRIPNEAKWQFCEYEGVCGATGSILLSDFYLSKTIPGVTVQFKTISDYTDYNVEMNQATFDLFLGDDVYQVSLLTESDVGVNALIRRVALIMGAPLQPKYKIFYPYQSEAPDAFTAFLTVFNIIGATVLLVVTIAAATLISFLIFKAIINTKLRDYAIFRTIGANQSLITNMIYLENVFTAAVAYLGLLTVILVFKMPGAFLYDVLKFYNLGSLIILLGMMLLMAVLISRRYCKKIFKDSVQKTLKSE
jgi:putative ABC transport system permease protein